MRIAVVGTTGMLGHVLLTFLKGKYPVHGVTRTDFDVLSDDFSVFSDLVKGSDWIINCIGIVKSVVSEYTPEEVLKVNTLFPRNLATLGRQVIHITTDCVYSGRKGSYSEQDDFDADDLYGISKLGGEDARNMNLRTSIVGLETKGRSRCLFEWARSKKGQQISGFTNHLWNGLTTTYLAEVISAFITENMFQSGTFHIHSPNTVSKFELLNSFNEHFLLGIKILPTQTAEKCDRSLRSNHSLSSEYVKKSIDQQIFEHKHFFDKYLK